MREKLLKFWRNDSEIFAHFGRLKTPYADELLGSKFCLHVKGFEVNTARIADSLYYGCVPIIIANYYDLPFADIPNWKSFSIAVVTVDPIARANPSRDNFWWTFMVTRQCLEGVQTFPVACSSNRLWYLFHGDVLTVAQTKFCSNKCCFGSQVMTVFFFKDKVICPYFFTYYFFNTTASKLGLFWYIIPNKKLRE